MQSRKTNSLKNVQWDKYMVYIIFIVVFALFAIALGDKGFLNKNNILNILRQTSMISVMAVAGVFVMGAAQIDLTVGSVAAMSAMIVSMILRSTNSIPLALVTALAFGCAIGMINGLLVTKLGLPSFLATLGIMQMVRGGAMWITDTAAVPIDNELYCQVFGVGTVLGLPVLIVWTILFYIAGIILFNRTPFGRHVLATGGNEVSANYSGINTVKVKITAFMMSGAFAAFAGIMYSGRLQAGRYSYGNGDEMSVIASVVLGGTAMSGGTGSVIGALFGSILMGMINNALILANLSSAQQTMVKGAIIVLAVAISNIAQKKRVN